MLRLRAPTPKRAGDALGGDEQAIAVAFDLAQHEDLPEADERQHEHDGARWLALPDAHREVVWPGYRTAIERIRDELADPARLPWFELTMTGERRPRE